MKLDVIIPILKNDLNTFLFAYPYLLENLPVKKIILIGDKNIQQEIKNLNYVTFLDENQIIDGLSLKNIQFLKKNISGNDRRSGWYFQQFLKMAYARISTSEYYLIWDADTIPINKIKFFDDKEKPYLSYRNYVKSDICYNIAQSKLLINEQIKKQSYCSFITEHMLIKTEIMKDLLHKIECNTNISGTSFYEKILNSIPLRYINLSGFSEFETYAAFTLKFYPEVYTLRKWINLRTAKIYIGNHPDRNDIEWIKSTFNVISIEKFYSYWFPCKFIKYIDKNRKRIAFNTLYKILNPITIFFNTIRPIIRDIIKR